MKKKILLLSLMLNSCVCLLAQSEFKIASPNGRIEYQLALNQEGIPVYSVTKDKVEIITGSKIGFVFRKGGQLMEDIGIRLIGQDKKEGSFVMPVGKTSLVRFNHNEKEFLLTEKSGLKRSFRLIVRASDDGIAFRYVFSEQVKSKSGELMAELTEFRFKNDYPCWVQHLPHFNFNYEKGFDKTTISQIYGDIKFSDPVLQYLMCYNFPAAHNSQKLIGLPLVCDLGNSGCLAIAEADLKDYAGMYLQHHADDPQMVNVILAPLRGANGTCVKLNEIAETPWRVVMMADNPAGLIESTFLLSLNRPCKIDDVSWIKPGTSTWDFLSGRSVSPNAGFQGGINMETFKYYIDFASEYKMQYFTIDEGWCPGTIWYRENPSVNQLKWADGIDIPQIVRYGKERNVGIFLWARWDNIRENMDTIFAAFESWGVKGVKIDFMDSDDQWMVNWYEKCLSTAAKYHLMINFHGAYKPTGLIRTYPNFITQEGVKGLEWSNTTNTLTSAHNVTLAYTRMLLGPMDYTPVGYNNVLDEHYSYSSHSIMTTRAHQLALTVLYESGIVTISEAPHILREAKESEILKSIPASWDETRFIDGKPDEYVVLARRKGEEWFISGINNGTPREIEFPITFIENNENLQIELCKDSPNADSDPKSVIIESRSVNNNDRLRLRLAKNGGFIVHIH